MPEWEAVAGVDGQWDSAAGGAAQSLDVVGLVGVGTLVGFVSSVLATLALRAVYAPAAGVALYRPSIDPAALLAIVAVMALARAFVRSPLHEVAFP